MKATSFILSILLLLTTIIIGCKKSSNDDGLPYYQFSDNEKSSLLNLPTLGNEFVYKNQDNEKISFYIVEASSAKRTYSTGTFSGGNLSYYHYDMQYLKMQYSKQRYSWSDCEINVEKSPNQIGGTPIFKAYMTFPLWNGFNGTDTFSKTINIDFGLPVSSMTINSKTYNNVRTLNSNKTKVLEPNNQPPGMPRNVNIIYYDANFGIIGFDDLNGKKWRLQ